jgi:hypothetical protein
MCECNVYFSWWCVCPFVFMLVRSSPFFYFRRLKHGNCARKAPPPASCFNLHGSFILEHMIYHGKIKTSHAHKVISLPCMRVSATRSGVIAQLQLFPYGYDLEVACQPCPTICFAHSLMKASSLVIKRMILRLCHLTSRLIPATFCWGASHIDRRRLFVRGK